MCIFRLYVDCTGHTEVDYRGELLAKWGNRKHHSEMPPWVQSWRQKVQLQITWITPTYKKPNANEICVLGWIHCHRLLSFWSISIWMAENKQTLSAPSDCNTLWMGCMSVESKGNKGFETISWLALMMPLQWRKPDSEVVATNMLIIWLFELS